MLQQDKFQYLPQRQSIREIGMRRRERGEGKEEAGEEEGEKEEGEEVESSTNHLSGVEMSQAPPTYTITILLL